jgi:hypothetical protein
MLAIEGDGLDPFSSSVSMTPPEEEEDRLIDDCLPH